MSRRRVWCELLPPEELAAPGTLALLRRFGVEPIVALPPARETPALAAALGALGRAGICVGLWPLLDDAAGYWPSRDNVDAFALRVDAALAFAAASGAHVTTVAVDLEPPLAVVRRFDAGGALARAQVFAERAFGAARREGRTRELEARGAFAALVDRLAGRGLETMAAVVPFVLADLAWGAPLFQAVLHTPVVGPAWSVVSPMLYTSMMAAELPSRSLVSARALLYEGARVLVAHVGPARASVSIGLAGPGKLGHEPVLPGPAELALDVAAARAAGVEDLALFSLEGILGREAPEAWLRAFTETPPAAPAGFVAHAVSSLVRGAVWASRPLARLGEDP